MNITLDNTQKKTKEKNNVLSGLMKFEILYKQHYSSIQEIRNSTFSN